MKRHDLIAQLEQAGCYLIRRGGKHDIDHNPDTGKTEPIPRHREINERLAKKIIKSLTGDR
ncbi:MAG: type II toxin-antitoxin system HicA family toxin [Microcystis aeruginosa Ma_QC_Ch_20071001_S25]|jgi:predicted RNA binding protein YcfA (HicA-like mRNA interferase family)|uniref:Type II toxin-antitoxin system HicA family toxin n=2 Tax=Microcystis aeruginosa TaxID=1126 RepID=A0A552FEI7_MICAE|nr:type II toxin-antitoxin system HicA family toxin [Microcystis aeruginosa WS75]NCQ87319.1 type II toxin-antitoxin system HicA family toxin [Microcystis aeruginosa W13-18]NCS50837.1 type II toxin-antitoxin system HicA family toxin [Microcystis aeruginosa BK11-02]TRU45104.1 MAG: type II toxin-antitoxin system HicA family toxin [Microcystis aeruginosa Ma_QC_Ca_00000000_S207]TRU47603.1 MAG: type II toxin-antitoxin system HicA family toxin [Microcystis aeruginosa Ma_QC_Ch_20071001_S25]TRU49803.1 